MRDLKEVNEEINIITTYKKNINEKISITTNALELQKLELDLKAANELLKELKEEKNSIINNNYSLSNESLETKQKNIQNQLNDILNNSQGKKMFLKYKGKQYYIPKKDRGKFLTLMTELNNINNTISNINIESQNNVTEFPNEPQTTLTDSNIKSPNNITEFNNEQLNKYIPLHSNTNQQIPELYDLQEELYRTAIINRTKIMTPSEKIQAISYYPNLNEETAYLLYAGKLFNEETKKYNDNNFLPSQKSMQEYLYRLVIESRMNNMTSYEKQQSQKSMPSTDEETRNRITAGKLFNDETSNVNKILNPLKTDTSRELSPKSPSFPSIPEKKLEIIPINKSLPITTTPELKIKQIRPAKFKNRIKKKLAQVAIILAASLAIGTFYKAKNSSIPQSNPSYQTTAIDNKDDTNIPNQDNSPTENQEETITEYINSFTEDKTNNTDNYSIENDQNQDAINIGDIVTLKPNQNIYKTALDSYFQENPYQCKYKDNTEERIIIGVSILCNNQTINIFACTEDYNNKINNLINDGGTIISVLTGNKEHSSLLNNYQGEKLTLTKQEINKNAEGWFPTDSIEEKGKGYSR